MIVLVSVVLLAALLIGAGAIGPKLPRKPDPEDHIY
jgi:hypothetical protein